MNIGSLGGINIRETVKEIEQRQRMPWNNGRINDLYNFPNILKLFEYINSGIKEESFFYSGKIYRLHSPFVTRADWIDFTKEFIVGKVSKVDNSCHVLPYTEETKTPCAFSKCYDFTRGAFPKVINDQVGIFLVCDTGNYFGIDVTEFLNEFGNGNMYEDEQEILFPIFKDHIIKECQCTPNQFKYYMRKQSCNNLTQKG